MDVKIEDIYNDGFEVEVEAIKQERAQVKQAQKSPSKKQRSTDASKHDFKPQFIHHLPDAQQQAMDSFVELTENSLQNKQIGMAKQQEDSFVCDCKWEAGGVPTRMACGEDSDCINRLTQVECPPDECRCGDHCQNQRIQNKEYAPLKIVQTEKKGFGVMAAADLPADALIMEYIGEVIAHNNFVRRLRDYSDSGIRHFYFMALQKDEYIDATKKGGKGRFINHSCNPNCYVAKWVVGKRLRMAIFSKRKVQFGEELTFNYNVDRYGHEAQECYCGEPNCVGFIGGKTQTDLGNMDDLYLDALGIADEVEALGLKGNRKKKGLKLDEDFVPILKPIVLADVPKVSSAIRQASSNKRILTKLLERVLMTEETSVQSQLMRLRGFSLMAMLLDEHKDDQVGVVIPVLRVLVKWPLLTKNKISSTSVESLVTDVLHSSADNTARDLSKQLLTTWSDLDLAYRIPKALQEATDSNGTVNVKRLRDDVGESILANKRLHLEDAAQSDILAFARDFVKPEASSTPLSKLTPLELARQQGLPTGWGVGSDPQGRPYYFHLQTRESRWSIPTREEAERIERAVARSDESLNDIISRARAQMDRVAAVQAAQATLAMPTTAPDGPSKEDRRAAREQQRKKKRQAKEMVAKERRVLQAFSPVVVKALTKYTGGCLDRDQFKRRAKELTNLLVDKEKRRETYAEEDYRTISSHQEDRIKSFTKSWAAKLLSRKGLHAGRPPASASSSAAGTQASSSTLADPSQAEAESMTRDVLHDFEAENEATKAGEKEAGEEEASEEESEDESSNTPETPMSGGLQVLDLKPTGAPMEILASLLPPPPPTNDSQSTTDDAA